MKEKDCIQNVIEELEEGQWYTSLSFVESRPAWAGSMMPNYYNYPYNENTHNVTICSDDPTPPVQPDVIELHKK